jgi:hypothetical protein
LIAVGWAAIGALIAPKGANPGFVDAAAVLAFAGLAAVAIERSIEGIFTVLASPLGQWWPLSTVKRLFDTVEAETNGLFTDVFTRVKEALADARKAAEGSAERIAEIDAGIAQVEAAHAKLSAQFEDARRNLAPGSSRLQRVSEVNRAMSDQLAIACEAAGKVAGTAHQALETTADATDRALLVISAFDDNPARRIASLIMGASIGMLAAGGLGLNLFAATLGDANGSDVPGLLAGALGVVITGIVIGFGASPTHEVIGALKEYKESRRGGQAIGGQAIDGGGRVDMPLRDIGGPPPTRAGTGATFTPLVRPTVVVRRTR